MMAKGRGVAPPSTRGDDAPQAKLTEDNVRSIRASTESHSALGRRYGVTHHAIRKVRLRQTWGHIT